MKKIKLFSLIAIAIFALASCTNNKHEKTIENLKAAATGETNASATYAKYAERAEADSMFNVAAMFRATSASETIHAANHLKALKEVGAEFTPQLKEIKVGTTLENLTEAKSGEDYEFNKMYPEFIKLAELEKADKAKVSFNSAMLIEFKHAEFYNQAITAINQDGNDANVNKVWQVCPVCGDTYKEGEVQTCKICGTSVEKFKTIK